MPEDKTVQSKFLHWLMIHFFMRTYTSKAYNARHAPPEQLKPPESTIFVLNPIYKQFEGRWAIMGDFFFLVRGMGDFSLILEVSGKSNRNLNRRMMGRFRRVLDDLMLNDIMLNGRAWSKDKENGTCAKLMACLDHRISIPSSRVASYGRSLQLF